MNHSDNLPWPGTFNPIGSLTKLAYSAHHRIKVMIASVVWTKSLHTTYRVAYGGKRWAAGGAGGQTEAQGCKRRQPKVA